MGFATRSATIRHEIAAAVRMESSPQRILRVLRVSVVKA
jgi:hypothetical protein